MRLLITVEVEDNDPANPIDWDVCPPDHFALCIRYEDALYDSGMPGQMSFVSARWLDEG